jgi:hypothetical protein
MQSPSTYYPELDARLSYICDAFHFPVRRAQQVYLWQISICVCVQAQRCHVSLVSVYTQLKLPLPVLLKCTRVTAHDTDEPGKSRQQSGAANVIAPPGQVAGPCPSEPHHHRCAAFELTRHTVAATSTYLTRRPQSPRTPKVSSPQLTYLAATMNPE